MLWVKCNGVIEHVPGSWPSVPRCSCLPPFPSISPAWVLSSLLPTLGHPHPDPEHILTPRFKNPWGSPICCGLGGPSPCRGALPGLSGCQEQKQYLSGHQHAGLWAAGRVCHDPVGRGGEHGELREDRGLRDVLFLLPPCLGRLLFAPSGSLETALYL